MCHQKWCGSSIVNNFNLVKDNTVGPSGYLHVIIMPGQTKQSEDILIYHVSYWVEYNAYYEKSFERRLLHVEWDGMEGQLFKLIYLLWLTCSRPYVHFSLMNFSLLLKWISFKIIIPIILTRSVHSFPVEIISFWHLRSNTLLC